ncbi:ADP-ribosylglycohydrolase family protein [Boseongicola sp. H5]|uniref:ADP-ribosylglycohydrolase family protein n=1 Tax=Boseongicola sp. H5 TaxID=2763261 RepID=UPI001D0A0F29|nr:ADP-ribosylglycohydrolase family protein [Boseongicola sp. H5]
MGQTAVASRDAQSAEHAKTPVNLPDDYVERVYAGVLGKMIGVYLGRPVEQWTHEKIMRELGEIRGYVHEKCGVPLIVVDDDLSGTFTFLRALEDEGCPADLPSEAVGRAWLNNLIEHRTVLWWGGKGTSTEHTAWLNLDHGIAAPASGSIETNGATVAEQIGAQIFIDGWAMVAPGQPELAARLARSAGRVSHDGSAVDAAALWAAMEAEAFVSSDVEHLLATGLAQIPADGDIARLIADIRKWVAEDGDWRVTLKRIQTHYGYQHYLGSCHVIPNHALMIMALLYAPNDFAEAQMIVNTSGWDTDCNAGNLGCLMGIMLGLDALDGPKGDHAFRHPVADRLFVSSAEGGRSITNGAEIALWIADMGRRLAGHDPLPAPKDGAPYHFLLRGSVQGFIAEEGEHRARTSVRQVPGEGDGALAVTFEGVSPSAPATVYAATASPPEMREYSLQACPRVYPGQTLRIRLKAAPENGGAIDTAPMIKVFDLNDRLVDVMGPTATVAPGEEKDLTWVLPENGGQPIGAIGVHISTPDAAPSAGQNGTILLDKVWWDGAPDFTILRPDDGHTTFRGRKDKAPDAWRLAFVNGATALSRRYPPDIQVINDRGEGIVTQGTRDWRNYTVSGRITLAHGAYCGVALRARGLRRYYAVRVARDGKVDLIHRHDMDIRILASGKIDYDLAQPLDVEATVRDQQLTACVNGLQLSSEDTALESGAMGLLLGDGTLWAERLHIGPA